VRILLLLLLWPAALWADSPRVLPGGVECSTADTAWLQLDPCPLSISEARSSTSETAEGGQRIVDHRVSVRVAQEHFDHDEFCALLERPPAELVITSDEKETLRAGAKCRELPQR